MTVTKHYYRASGHQKPKRLFRRARAAGFGRHGVAAVGESIVEKVDVYGHPTSTVAMGPEGDGVVDALGRVYDVERLMVVDASVVPLVPSAPTNLTTMMIAERLPRPASAATDPRDARDNDG
jgi:choline dehydrogenase-like flavoprotein